MSKYLKLEQKFKQITHLGNLARILHWDSAVMLGSGSAASRQQELATFSGMIHDLLISNEIGDLIQASLSEFDDLDDWQRANLANIKRAYDGTVCINSELQHEHSIASSECEFAWRSARKENDFKRLEPYLDRVFDSVRRISALKSEKLKKPILDVLVDAYDPERTSVEVKTVFDALKAELPALINQIIEKQKSGSVIELSEKISEKTQKAIGLKIMQRMEFNFDCGRLDKSVHPFCTGSDDDVRITTRYDENYFLSSLFGIIHETGHALYQQNLPQKYRNQPVGGPKGMSFHESQSLIMENQVGTSRSFIEYLATILHDEFGLSGTEYSADNLYKLVTRVQPSFIRVDADEATYPLHIILRFEIEESIINGNLRAADIPELWNSKMQEYLGITPPDDALGCLQDIHWPSGMLGYFPSYTNGAIIASMLMEAAKADSPDIETEISHGKFTSLNSYLNKNLRSLGCSKNSSDLLLNATGNATIQPDIFMNYLREKYT